MPDWSDHIVVIVLVTALASFVQGYAGFGIGIVCMATLSYATGGLAELATLIVLLAFVVMLIFLVFSRSRTPVKWKQVGLLLPGMLVGIPLGYWFISVFGNMPIASLCLGVVLAAFGVQGLLFRRIHRPLPNIAALPAGGFAGLLSGAFSTGGPPLVLYLYAQRPDPREMKSSVTAALLALSAFRIVTAAAAGGITTGLLRVVLLCLPGVIAMLFAGHWLSTRARAQSFRKVIYGLIGVSGVIMAGRAVTTML